MDMRIIKALVTDGHVPHLPSSLLAHLQLAPHLQLSDVQWLLQQRVSIDSETLLWAARTGREDVLHLAHNMHMPIATDVITAAATKFKWGVLVWALRNDLPVDRVHIQRLLHQQGAEFKFAEQQWELVSLLYSGRQARKRK